MTLTMTPASRDRKIAALRDLITMIESMPVGTPCRECENFNASDGTCFRWNAVVPVENRAAGCAEWEEGLPF